MTDASPVERLQTGINGFDDVAMGGLPAGRPTLVGGTTGSGKTLFAIEFLARGILRSGEPGIFVSFEETAQDIRRNCASFGFPIAHWEQAGQWAFIDASDKLDEEASVIGAYDLGALVARIQHAVRLGARRVCIDSLSAVFSRFAGGAIARQEMHRIAAALAELGVTSIITAERAHEYGGLSVVSHHMGGAIGPSGGRCRARVVLALWCAGDLAPGVLRHCAGHGLRARGSR